MGVPTAAGSTRALLTDLLGGESFAAGGGAGGGATEELALLLSADRAGGLCLRGPYVFVCGPFLLLGVRCRVRWCIVRVRVWAAVFAARSEGNRNAG